MPTHFDAAIFGGGQAGPSLANRLSQTGLTVAIIEQKNFGGTCVNTGCTPTKTLVASAYAARVAARAAEYGVILNGGFSVDMQKVKARKDAVVRDSRESLEKWLSDMPRCTVLRPCPPDLSP
jgi:pyruvate/2-oxoglutarate dehydrogenase complex dihydrolipoamide dehydrogenase (E3) component